MTLRTLGKIYTKRKLPILTTETSKTKLPSSKQKLHYLKAKINSLNKITHSLITKMRHSRPRMRRLVLHTKKLSSKLPIKNRPKRRKKKVQ